MSAVPPFADMAVEALSAKDALTAYPLIRTADPSLTLRVWLRYASRLSGHDRARHGVLTARRAGQRHPSGAVCFRCERQVHGSVLIAEHFVALDLLYPDKVISALLRGLDRVAARLSCEAIRVIVRGDAAALEDNLRKAGHHAEGISMTKPVSYETIM